MEQYWYVVKEKKHFGPFELKDLKKLYQENKIASDMSLWHPKWPKPISWQDPQFSHWWDLPEQSATPPSTPLEPIIAEKKYLPVKSLKYLTRLKSHEIDFADTYELPVTEKKILFPKRIDQRLLMALCLVIATFAIDWKMDQPTYPQRPTVMAPSQYNNLKNFWTNDQTAIFSASVSKDFKTLWVAQKTNGNITSIQLEANAKSLISKSSYSKTWSPDKDQSPQLINLKFDNNKLPPLGFYKLTIVWSEPSIWGIDQENKTSIVDLTIGNLPEANIKNLVKKFHAPTNNSNTGVATTTATQKPFVVSDTADLKQKYETLNFLIADIKKNWSDIKDLKAKALKKAMADFQNNYAKSTGSFLTAMVLNNESEIKSLSSNKKPINTKIITHLYHLTETAKKTGILSAELMSEYGTLAKNSQKNKQWNQKLSAIEQDLLDKIRQL